MKAAPKYGPLWFDPKPHLGRGDFISTAELRRRCSQAWAERIRLCDALGWWEDAPPLPDGLRPEPEILAQAS